jgi:hypothetical protein
MSGADTHEKSSVSPPAADQGLGGPPSGGNARKPPNHQRIRRRNRLITSCLECRRRKLKCDKTQPCGNCTRFQRDCVFIAPALDAESQQRLAEIKEKMGNLERTLEEDVAKKKRSRDTGLGSDQTLPGQDDIDSSEDEEVPDDEKNLEGTPYAVEDVTYDEDADDELVDLGVQLGKMRITERIGGFVRPKMVDEARILPFTIASQRTF